MTAAPRADTQVATLSIPKLAPGVDNLTAALAYAAAGWYVLPVRRGSKHPGSVVGNGWQHQSSRDPEQIAAWFAGTDHGIALHAGRSGAVLIDMDYPEKTPPDVLRAVEQSWAPFQSSRADADGRGHYVFAQPPGRTLGNSVGSFRGCGFEVRGNNGVIIVVPSVHQEAERGGRYAWELTGPVPVLPARIADNLPEATEASESATDAQVTEFLKNHTDATNPAILHGWRKALQTHCETGSRHDGAVPVMAGAMKEARAGFFPACEAVDLLRGMFITAATRPPTGGEKQRTESGAGAEFDSILAWAVGQANAADLDEVRARTAAKMPNNVEWVDGVGEPPDDDPGPEEPPPDDDPGEDAETIAFEYKVAGKLYALRVAGEARRRLDEEEQPSAEPPPLEFLDDVLAEPETPIAYRIDDVAPAGSRVILSAQWKAGKTTIVGNLIRALVDAVLFLGRFAVNTPARRVVLIDDELSRDMNRKWLADQHISNTHAVVRCSLRGSVSSFNLLDDRCRRWWAQHLIELGCDYLILDCLRPVLDAIGLDEHHDAGKFLVAFDRLLDEAAIPDAAIVHHMGHTGERARGDSRIEDWPDVIWRINRQHPDDPTSPRYFSAFGRDVNVREGRLGYDPTTRHLTYVAGSRQDSKAEAAYLAVVGLLAAGDPLGVRAIQDSLTPDNPRDAVRKAIKLGVDKGVLMVEKGKNNAKLHCIAYPCTECGLPVVTQAGRHLSCPSGPEPLPNE